MVTFDEKQTGDGDFGVRLELSDKEMEHLNDDEIGYDHRYAWGITPAVVIAGRAVEEQQE